MQTNHFAVTDLETTGLSPIAEGEYKKAQITEISVHIINGHTLEINKDDHFHSLVWIEQDLKKCEELGLEPLSDEIAEKTHKDRKELLKAPKEEVVWEKLAQFLKKYRSKGNTNWNNPILAGWNCVGYDKKIIDVRAKQYGQWDLKYQDNTMFHPRDTLDGLQLAFYMFSDFPSIKSLSLDNITYFS
jgi:DNA polymerase III epsilon subunit-like protein